MYTCHMYCSFDPEVHVTSDFYQDYARPNPVSYRLKATLQGMATPLVGQSVAIPRDVLCKDGRPDLSAAPIKALRINGVECLPNTPIVAQGFGSINLMSFDNITTVSESSDNGMLPPAVFQECAPLRHGDKVELQIKILRGLHNVARWAFKITLVYPDAPGPVLQTNLDFFGISDWKRQARKHT